MKNDWNELDEPRTLDEPRIPGPNRSVRRTPAWAIVGGRMHSSLCAAICVVVGVLAFAPELAFAQDGDGRTVEEWLSVGASDSMFADADGDGDGRTVEEWLSVGESDAVGDSDEWLARYRPRPRRSIRQRPGQIHQQWYSSPQQPVRRSRHEVRNKPKQGSDQLTPDQLSRSFLDGGRERLVKGVADLLPDHGDHWAFEHVDDVCTEADFSCVFSPMSRGRDGGVPREDREDRDDSDWLERILRPEPTNAAMCSEPDPSDMVCRAR